jgi:hypothetical protein
VSGVYFPSAPLLDRVRDGRPWHRANGACTYCSGDRSSAACVTTQEVADVLDVTHETVSRWKAGRRVSVTHADDLAVRAGAHPGELWPSWWATCPDTKERAA